MTTVVFAASFACGDDATSTEQSGSDTQTDAGTNTETGPGDGDPGDGDGDGCEIATENCPCTGGGACDPGLTCDMGICVPCQIATEGCACTEGGACDPGLSCDGGICVPLGGDGDPGDGDPGDGDPGDGDPGDGDPGDGDGDPGPSCGDGVVEGSEQCDDANMDDTDDCTSMCLDATCGDGFVQAGVEECDDANMDDTDACLAGCVAATCGDGFVQAGVEECDDANMDDTDACLGACLSAVCGDGFVQAGVEECDDGNMDDMDYCDNACVDTGPPVSCKAILDADPNAADGVYEIDPDGFGGSASQLILCDMSTDDGGWTLVASTRQTMLRDEASPYYADLQTFNPGAGHTGVWDGMRAVINGGNSDIRFTCITNPNANSPTVDLSFYDIIWYDEITTGTDAQCCFSEQNGMGDDQPTPARRDNVANVSLMANDQWNAAGYLEGEDNCDDGQDFTVDFDDRGMDSNESDGTDWGQDDGVRKCGTAGLGNGAWHIWVREL